MTRAKATTQPLDPGYVEWLRECEATTMRKQETVVRRQMEPERVAVRERARLAMREARLRKVREKGNKWQ